MPVKPAQCDCRSFGFTGVNAFCARRSCDLEGDDLTGVHGAAEASALMTRAVLFASSGLANDAAYFAGMAKMCGR